MLSTLSCRPVRITKIREDDEDPGIKGKIEPFQWSRSIIKKLCPSIILLQSQDLKRFRP